MSLCVCIVSMLDTSFFHYNKNVSWLLSRRLELSLQLPSLLLLLLAIGVSLQCCHCADEVVVVAVFFSVFYNALDSNGFLHLDK